MPEVSDNVITYKSQDAPCGIVQFRNSYKYVWQLDDGSYVLKDSVSFKPYLAMGQKGRRLHKVKRRSENDMSNIKNK